MTDLVEEAAILFFKIYITLKVILEKRTLGDFSLYINSIDNFRGSATTILNTIVTIFEDGLYIQNLFEFLDMKTTERIENSLSFNKNFQKIEFKNVWFRYPESVSYTHLDVYKRQNEIRYAISTNETTTRTGYASCKINVISDIRNICNCYNTPFMHVDESEKKGNSSLY